MLGLSNCPWLKIFGKVRLKCYDGSDESLIYELRRKAPQTKQQGRPIQLYFAELNNIWQELDKHQPSSKMVRAAGLKSRKKDLIND